MQQVPQPPIQKLTPQYSSVSSFSKNLSMPRSRFSKRSGQDSVNEDSINYTTLVLQDLPQGHILSNLRNSARSPLFLSRIFVEFSLKSLYPTMFGEPI